MGPFHETLARGGLTDHVTPMVASSDDAAALWRGPVRLLWIDGSHVQDQVSRDFRNWTPFVVDGGIVAFHDTYEYEGVRRVIDEEVVRSPDLVLVGLVDTIAAFRRQVSARYGPRTCRGIHACGPPALLRHHGYVRHAAQAPEAPLRRSQTT